MPAMRYRPVPGTTAQAGEKGRGMRPVAAMRIQTLPTAQSICTSSGVEPIRTGIIDVPMPRET